MRRPDTFHRYQLNVLGRLGNKVVFRLGAEESVRSFLALFPIVDQRDGFEVALGPCNSSPAQAAASETSGPLRS